MDRSPTTPAASPRCVEADLVDVVADTVRIPEIRPRREHHRFEALADDGDELPQILRHVVGEFGALEDEAHESLLQQIQQAVEIVEETEHVAPGVGNEHLREEARLDAPTQIIALPLEQRDLVELLVHVVVRAVLEVMLESLLEGHGGLRHLVEEVIDLHPEGLRPPKWHPAEFGHRWIPATHHLGAWAASYEQSRTKAPPPRQPPPTARAILRSFRGSGSRLTRAMIRSDRSASNATIRSM